MGIFTITGPSGVGKTKLYEGLILRKRLRLEKVVTCTTRRRRENEREGVDYRFLSERQFQEGVCQGDFLEHAHVYGYNYGCRESDVRRTLSSGLNPLFVLDIQGAITMRNYFGKENTSIFLLPDNIEELMFRLKDRKTDEMKAIETRIAHAEHEISQAHEFDYQVVNRKDRLKATIERVAEIIKLHLS